MGVAMIVNFSEFWMLPPKSAPLLICPKCKLEMSLVGIEAEKPERDLFTFECTECDRIEARSAPAK
jgi:hypothetical protein